MMRTKLICFASMLVATAMMSLAASESRAALPSAGTIAFGLSTNNATTTLELIDGDPVLNGGASLASPWQATPFLQAVEFDNYGGVAHNAQGNLLALNFGTTAGGGEIYSLATSVDPAPAGQLIGNTKVSPDNLGQAGDGSVTLSRLGGLSVSPDNTKVAVAGYDSGAVIVFDYTAGDTTGSGAALTGGRQTALTTIVTGSTQGTVWKNDSTVLAFSSFGTLVEVNATTMAATVVGGVDTPFAGSNLSAIAYSPEISPYVYGMYSGFSGGTVNKLYVFDPANSYALVKEIDFSASAQTGRDIVLGANGDLFLSAYGGSAAPGATIEYFPAANVLNPATLTDNSSVDWYKSPTQSSFNNIDIGFGTVGDFLAADFNEDGAVDATDLNDHWKVGFGTASGAAKTNGDANEDGVVDGADFLIWQQQFGLTPTAVAVSAVPEPTSAVTALLAAAVGCAAFRRRG